MFIYDVRRITLRPLPGVVKIVVLTGILLALFFPKELFYQHFDAETALAQARELSSDKYEGRRSGTAGRDKAADFIVSQLKEMGLKPGGREGFVYPFKLPDLRYNVKQRFAISTDNKGWTEMQPYKDFMVVNYGNGTYSGPVSYNSSDVQNKALVLKMDPKKGAEITIAILYSSGKGSAKAVILVSNDTLSKSALQNSGISASDVTIPLIVVSKELGDKLLNGGNVNVSFEVKTGSLDTDSGKNIMGYIPGTDEKLRNQFIVVGASYDGMGFNNGIKLQTALEGSSPAAMNLELARTLMKKGLPKRSIIFAFWDYSGRQASGASFLNSFPGRDIIRDCLYIDLKYLGIKNGRELVLDTSRVASDSPDSQRLSKYFKNTIRDMGFKMTYKSINSDESYSMQHRGLSCITVASANGDKITGTSDDTIDIVDLKTYRDIGQGIVNALIKIAY